jgi:hypothetical protein
LRSGPPKPIATTGDRENAAFERQQRGELALRRSIFLHHPNGGGGVKGESFLPDPPIAVSTWRFAPIDGKLPAPPQQSPVDNAVMNAQGQDT